MKPMSVFVFAFTFIVIYLKDALIKRIDSAHLPLKSLKTYLIQSVDQWSSFLSLGLLSCVLCCAMGFVVFKLKNDNFVVPRIMNIINTHVMLLALFTVLALFVIPSLKAIKYTLGDSGLDLLTFWLVVFLIIGGAFSICLLGSIKDEICIAFSGGLFRKSEPVIVATYNHSNDPKVVDVTFSQEKQKRQPQVHPLQVQPPKPYSRQPRPQTRNAGSNQSSDQKVINNVSKQKQDSSSNPPLTNFDEGVDQQLEELHLNNQNFDYDENYYSQFDTKH